MVPACLKRRYASRIYKHFDAIRTAAAWHTATETEREAPLATGGRGAGALWMQLPDRPIDFLGPAHFRTSELRRYYAWGPSGPREGLPASSRLAARGFPTPTMPPLDAVTSPGCAAAPWGSGASTRCCASVARPGSGLTELWRGLLLAS